MTKMISRSSLDDRLTFWAIQAPLSRWNLGKPFAMDLGHVLPSKDQLPGYWQMRKISSLFSIKCVRETRIWFNYLNQRALEKAVRERGRPACGFIGLFRQKVPLLPIRLRRVKPPNSYTIILLYTDRELERRAALTRSPNQVSPHNLRDGIIEPRREGQYGYNTKRCGGYVGSVCLKGPHVYLITWMSSPLSFSSLRRAEKMFQSALVGGQCFLGWIYLRGYCPLFLTKQDLSFTQDSNTMKPFLFRTAYTN